MKSIELIATAAFGLEAVVAREVKNLGYEEVRVEDGKVTFRADLRAIARANIWLRSADRVLLKLGAFPATTFEELFKGTRNLDWPAWLPKNANFPVQGKSVRSKLFSVPDCQAIVKKAIVEKMKERYKVEWFEETGPRYSIEVAFLKDMATLTIDTSGAGLHKRGYRTLTGKAPLKETLAAALVSLSYWRPEKVLIDPMCGSGTIPIEAALIGLNVAPGLRRQFAAESWPTMPELLWQEARQEAQDSIRAGKLTIRGTDVDEEAISLARYHARQAGVDKHIHWQRLPLAELRASQKYGCIICNPPYGQRLEEQPVVEKLYEEMGRVFQPFDTWSIYVLSAHPGFERLFGRRAARKRKLYNGRIQCNYYQYPGPPPPRRTAD
ncbi:MAG: class I SAM-dependent RNA methyltransferase [Syntrophomonadaceae bacterium]|nr:class I SAM-dependent RNA methyltransferase [Syntrophomonadaceae bacterium]